LAIEGMRSLSHKQFRHFPDLT